MLVWLCVIRRWVQRILNSRCVCNVYRTGLGLQRISQVFHLKTRQVTSSLHIDLRLAGQMCAIRYHWLSTQQYNNTLADYRRNRLNGLKTVCMHSSDESSFHLSLRPLKSYAMTLRFGFIAKLKNLSLVWEQL